MARARNLKPGFFLNEELVKCEPLARILFAGLWCLADRTGRLEDRPERIKAEVLPYDQCNADNLLDQLAGKGFIVRYQAAGVRAIQITKFARHQSPHPKETSFGLPPPPEPTGNLSETLGTPPDGPPGRRHGSRHAGHGRCR